MALVAVAVAIKAQIWTARLSLRALPTAVTGLLRRQLAREVAWFRPLTGEAR
jgi:hypothetical protein